MFMVTGIILYKKVAPIFPDKKKPFLTKGLFAVLSPVKNKKPGRTQLKKKKREVSRLPQFF
jgi:hypothetical protein